MTEPAAGAAPPLAFEELERVAPVDAVVDMMLEQVEKGKRRWVEGDRERAGRGRGGWTTEEARARARSAVGGVVARC